MLPSSNEIFYFLEVASTLNISRAAERLGVTQPTLSLSIQRLEQSLGSPLLLRGKSGVRLTKTGARFAQGARTLVEQWQRLRDEALKDEVEVRGRVTIGCHSSVALYSVGHYASALLTEHPALEIAFVHDLSRKITERVISFEVDLGVVINPVAHPDLRLVPLGSDEVGFWRSSGEYARDVLICDPALVQTQSLLSDLRRRSKDKGFEFKRVIHSSSLEVIAKLAASGAGVGILPSRVARSEASLKLKPLVAGGPVFEDKIFLVYRPDAQKSQASRVVIKAIETALKKL